MIILVTRSQKYKIDDLRMYCQINALIATSDSVITVGSGKDFASIQEAVDYAQDGWTIVVYPGEYEEAVDAHEKTIRIIGMDKATCILKYPNSDYSTPPLEMGAGELINMTIYAMGEDKKEDAIAKAYAMHTDYNISRDNKLYIRNVDFINDD